MKIIQDTDKTSRLSFKSDKKKLLTRILYIIIKKTNKAILVFLYAKIFLSQIEPLFRLPRETLFVQCF